MYVFRGRGSVLPIYQPPAGVCVLRVRRLHSWICRRRRTTRMLSALYQRSGYATAYAVDPLLPVPAFVSTALEEEARRMAKRESKRMKRSASRSSAETQNTTTSPQSVNNNAQPKRIMSIDARLREIMGDVLTEEQLQTKFTFGRLLGSGATSKVYAALENATGQQVAIKVFDKATMIDVRRSMVADGEFVQEKAVRRVQRRLLKIVSELEICRSLDHPNIIKYLGAYETSHRLCIVHELVDGCDLLEHLLTHGKMDDDQAASVFRQLLLALEYCHSHDIYHRDLKLENVLITKDLQVKLIDFGLSEIVPPGQTLKTICGTPLYCSPEILFMHSSSRETGFQGGPADVWSIGILIFALLTGCAPFDDSSFVRLREDVHRNRIAYPSYLSNQVKGLLKLLLIFDPLLRPTVSDILGYEWIRKASASVIPVERAESPRRQCLSPSHKRCEHRSLSDNCTDTTASTSGSFEGDARNLHKITEEPHDHSEITLPTHLSCLERDLEHLMSVKHQVNISLK